MRDFKIEMGRWKKKLYTATVIGFFTVLCSLLYLFLAWIADGWIDIRASAFIITGSKTKGTVLAAIWEMVPFAVAGGIFTGFIGGWFIVNRYKHPITLLSNIPKEGLDENPLLAEGEKFIRGARLHLGCPEVIYKSAEEFAFTAGRKLGKEYLLPVTVAGAPMPYKCENIGLYIQGAAGSGKSQVLKQMIHDIRNRGGRDRLIIYDRKPEYLPLFYRDGDVIICPADVRHTPWDLFAEISGEQDLDLIVMSLFPDMPGTQANDFFWTQSARKVFKGILIYLMHKAERTGVRATNRDLVTFLNSYASEPAVLWKELKKDPAAASFASTLAGAEKKSQSNVPTSTMATLTSYTYSFTRPEVAENGWFSIREWLRDDSTEGQAVFLMNPARYEDNYKSYFTVILDLALKEMISLPNDIDRRVWFFVDEFGSLFKLSSVVRLLAEGRSKGACTILGTQDMAQIKQQYEKETETIINNCNNKVIARVTSFDEADYLSKNVGQAEIEQSGESESISFDDKQGLQTSLQERRGEKRRETRNVVLSSEIMELPNLNYFVKFAEYDWFRSRIDYYPWSMHELVPPFLMRPSSYFDTSRVIVGRGDEDEDEEFY
jgi:hypothetical protein